MKKIWFIISFIISSLVTTTIIHLSRSENVIVETNFNDGCGVGEHKIPEQNCWEGDISISVEKKGFVAKLAKHVVVVEKEELVQYCDISISNDLFSFSIPPSQCGYMNSSAHIVNKITKKNISIGSATPFWGHYRTTQEKYVCCCENILPVEQVVTSNYLEKR